MAVYAIIPVKNLADSKKRLSIVFTPQEREKFTLAMLEDVLTALKSSVVDKVVVVAEDSQVQQAAEKFGAFYLFGNGATLNSAVEETTSYCIQKGAKSVLVLPTDVPLVNSKEIDRIIQLGHDSAVVLSPSSNLGTNALYQSPPDLIPACFGSDSFLKHIRESYRKRIRVTLHLSHELATDIDSVEDLKKLFEIRNTTCSKRFLEQMGFDPGVTINALYQTH